MAKLPSVCRECGEADPEKLKKRSDGSFIRACHDCVNAAQRRRNAVYPLVCLCGEADPNKLSKRQGKPVRICLACLRKSAESGRSARQGKPSKAIRSIICERCNQPKEVKRISGKTPKSCLECRQAGAPKAHICADCGTTENIKRFANTIKRVCNSCYRQRRQRWKAAKTAPTQGPSRYVPKPVVNDAPPQKPQKPSEVDRMARVRAAIKAIPVGVTVTPKLLYEISRRVAEGAL